MKIFYSQSISTIKSDRDGAVKKSFKIIKAKNDSIEEIKGISNNKDSKIFDIDHDFKKKNMRNGRIYSKHRAFKLKSDDILKLFKDSSEYKKNIFKKRENSGKKIIIIRRKNPIKNNNVKHDVKSDVINPFIKVIKKDVTEHVASPIIVEKDFKTPVVKVPKNVKDPIVKVPKDVKDPIVKVPKDVKDPVVKVPIFKKSVVKVPKDVKDPVVKVSKDVKDPIVKVPVVKKSVVKALKDVKTPVSKDEKNLVNSQNKKTIKITKKSEKKNKKINIIKNNK